MPPIELRLKKGEQPTAGKYAMCWYPKFDKDSETELFYCKIIYVGDGDYSTCEIYNEEEFDTSRKKGTFIDVCTADIMDFYPQK